MLFFTVCFFGLILCEVRAYEKSIRNGTIEPVIEGNKREIYTYEKTIVIRDLFSNGSVHRCDMMNTHYDEPTAPTIEEVREFFSPQPVQQMEMTEFLKIMASCDAVDETVLSSSTTEKPQHNSFSSQLQSILNLGKHLSNYVQNIRKNIYPGTKWCGRGNVADSYHDLGELRNVDRCCRMHDFCPMKISAKGELYGLKNVKDYTTSHCICDKNLYNCLKKVDQDSSGQIGWVYFSVLKPHCIQGLPPSNNSDSGSSDSVITLEPQEKKWFDTKIDLPNDKNPLNLYGFGK